MSAPPSSYKLHLRKPLPWALNNEQDAKGSLFGGRQTLANVSTDAYLWREQTDPEMQTLCVCGSGSFCHSFLFSSSSFYQTLFKMVSLMPFPCMNEALLPLLTKILSLIYLLAQAREFTVGCPYARALTEYHTLNDTSVLWSHLKIDEALPGSSHCQIQWYNSGFISPLSFLFSRKCLLWTFQRKFTE